MASRGHYRAPGVVELDLPDSLCAGRPRASGLRSLLTFHGDGLGYRLIRRAMDIVVSLAVLTVTLPLTVVIAIIIKLDSPGPILFRHRRIQDALGRPFILYKFRTMYADAPDRFPDLYTYRYSPAELATLPIKALVGSKTVSPLSNGVATSTPAASAGDPRVTRVGRWLRKTSLDELPNFINVLKGEMHLVGPRPDISDNIRYYEERHLAKLDVRPGITGLAQVSGRGRLSFIATNQLDIEYVANRSLWLDLKILAKTVVVTLKGVGAC